MSGFSLVAASCILFFAVAIISNFHISSNYKKATEEVAFINRYESALKDLNDSVNMTYLYLLKEGTGLYEERRTLVEQYLAESRMRSKRLFIREVVDADGTVESYLKQGSRLMEKLRAYSDTGDDDYEMYEQEYEELQTIYSYATDCFQSVYSVKLDILNEQEREIEHRQNMIMILQGVVLGLVFTGCSIYMRRIILETSKSIGILKRSVEQIQDNVFAAEPIEISSHDELEDFAGAFNQMIRIIRMQMQKIAENADIKEQLAKMEIENLKMFSALQKSHLDFLQARVNPHFLFNTLNMISSLARIENADKCVDLMEITASFLRYNLDNISKSVPLKKELENLKEYIAIQTYRYSERYQYYFDVDESCMEFQMPCMILQPLVENAIQHGVGMMRKGGCIWIAVRGEEERISLEVSDNGVGMSDEQIENVYQDIQNNHFSSVHIGIRNIYGRLKLFYHDDVKMSLKNRNPGLQIILSLPRRKRA